MRRLIHTYATPVRLWAGIAALLVAVAWFWVVPSLSTSSVETTAKRIVADCTKESDSETCYETEVPALYPRVSVPQIFDIVRAIRTLDPSYQFCHVLAHKVGGRVVAEDPAHWVDAIPLNPQDGLCSNGYIHGVIVGRFSSAVLDTAAIEKLVPDFARACEPRADWHPSDLDRAMCYHGMGHLFDFITDANLWEGLSLCDRIGRKPDNDFRQVCEEGVFMQIYQPLEPDDYALVARMKVVPTKENVRSFCAAYRSHPEYEGACLRESWPLFRDSVLNGTGVGAFCSGQPNKAETGHCYDSASAIVGRLSLGSTTQVAAACNNFPTAWQLDCFGSSAQAILEEDRNRAQAALSLCRLASSSVAEACVGRLVTHASFLFGAQKQEYDDFCNAVPASLYQTCKANESGAPPTSS